MSGEVTEFPRPVNPLPQESRDEARAARLARKGFAAVFGPFVRTMNEVMAAYHAARAQGMDREAAAAGIEEVLRQVWPRPTTKFGPKCQTCDDLGYEERVCRIGQWCQRQKCQEKGQDWRHGYVEPCLCAAGDKFRKKAYQGEDAIGAVAKVSKPKRGWSRAGA
jgi:hypothetical protein